MSINRTDNQLVQNNYNSHQDNKTQGKGKKSFAGKVLKSIVGLVKLTKNINLGKIKPFAKTNNTGFTPANTSNPPPPIRSNSGLSIQQNANKIGEQAPPTPSFNSPEVSQNNTAAPNVPNNEPYEIVLEPAYFDPGPGFISEIPQTPSSNSTLINAQFDSQSADSTISQLSSLIDGNGNENIDDALSNANKTIQKLTISINDLYDVSGSGNIKQDLETKLSTIQSQVSFLTSESNTAQASEVTSGYLDIQYDLTQLAGILTLYDAEASIGNFPSNEALTDLLNFADKISDDIDNQFDQYISLPVKTKVVDDVVQATDDFKDSIGAQFKDFISQVPTDLLSDELKDELGIDPQTSTANTSSASNESVESFSGFEWLQSLRNSSPEENERILEQAANFTLDSNTVLDTSGENTFLFGLNKAEGFREAEGHTGSGGLTGITTYTSDNYTTMNAILRSGKFPDNDNQTHAGWMSIIRSADIGLEQLAQTDGAGFEGVSVRGTQLSAEMANNLLQVGGTYQDLGFMSSSTDPSVAEGFKNSQAKPGKVKVMFEIEAKSGVFIDNISAYGGENEVLFRPGTEFKITSVNKDDSGAFFVKLQEQGAFNETVYDL